MEDTMHIKFHVYETQEIYMFILFYIENLG